MRKAGWDLTCIQELASGDLLCFGWAPDVASDQRSVLAECCGEVLEWPAPTWAQGQAAPSQLVLPGLAPDPSEPELEDKELAQVEGDSEEPEQGH